MKSLNKIWKRASAWSRRTSSFRDKRPGTTLVEVLVAFGLLATLGAILVPTLVRHSRLRQTMRHERLGLNELANLAERLTSLSSDDLPAALQSIEPSRALSDAVDVTQLTAVAKIVDESLQMTFELRWNAPGRRDTPLRLVAWRFDAAAVHAVQSRALPGAVDASNDERLPDSTQAARSMGERK